MSFPEQISIDAWYVRQSRNLKNTFFERLYMDSLNDMIWTDEEVLNEEENKERANVMWKPCSISIPSCDGSGPSNFYIGSYSGAACGC